MTNLGLILLNTTNSLHKPRMPTMFFDRPVLRQITAPMLNDHVGYAVSFFEPQSQQSLFLNDVQLYDIGEPSFASEFLPLMPSIAKSERMDHADVNALRTNGLYVFLHEETAHRIFVRRIPRCQEKNLQHATTIGIRVQRVAHSRIFWNQIASRKMGL